MDLMIHDIDLVLELVNSKIQKLAAVGGRNSEGLIDYVNAVSYTHLTLPTKRIV